MKRLSKLCVSNTAAQDYNLEHFLLVPRPSGKLKLCIVVTPAFYNCKSRIIAWSSMELRLTEKRRAKYTRWLKDYYTNYGAVAAPHCSPADDADFRATLRQSQRLVSRRSRLY
jgi:hypothetical protein